MKTSGSEQSVPQDAAIEDQKTLIEPVDPAATPQPGAANGEESSPLFTVHQPGAPLPLSRLGDYELIKEIGRGGMGVVFQARHVRLGRVVALKMILGGSLARAEDIQRFENEYKAAAQLQHSGIVALYEVGAYNNQPFFSMELVSGSSLSHRVAAGPLSSRRAAKYMEAVARAVHFAHTKDIIHRDLKPANVLLDENDQPKVTDFGLAKAVATDSGQTRTGAVLGTPSYMSPEQASGRKDIGPSSDIYSLGAVLYELLTGKPPFRGETPLATLTLVVEQEPIPPRLLNPEADRDLETICLKCLEKDPGRRYATAEDLALDLRRFLDGEPISARRLSMVGRAVKWCRRKPTLALLLFLVIAGPLSFMVFFYLTALEEKSLREKEQTSRENEQKSRRLAEISEKSLRFLLYDADIQRAYRALEDADLTKALGLMRKFEPNSDPKARIDLRDWEWYFLRERCRGPFAFEAHKGRASAVVYRPDGKVVATAGGDPAKPGEIKLWESTTGKLISTLTGHADSITSLAFNKDGTLLASGSFDKTIKIWDPEKATEIMTLKGHGKHVAGVAFSPKEPILASASGDGTVRIWDYKAYQNGEKDAVKVLKGHKKEVSAVAFSPSGDLLASAGFDDMVRIWKPESGEEKYSLKGHEGEVHAVAFSPTGKILASGGGKGSKRGEVKFWETDTGKLRFSRYGLSDRVLSLDFSKEGKLVAAGSDGLIRVWDQTLSSEATLFRGDTELTLGVAFTPDGEHFAAAGKSGRLTIFNTSGGMETHRLATPGQMETLAFSPNGHLLAVAGASAREVGEIRIFDLDAPNRPPLVLKGPSSPIDCLAFSPDGKALAAAGFDKLIRVYNLDRPDQEPGLLAGHEDRVRSLAFHPDGTMLASGSEISGNIHLWNITNHTLDKVLTGHGDSVQALAFRHDGERLASGSVDKLIKVWDLKTGTSFDLLGHSGVINSLAFSPNGLSLASGSSDRSLRIWNLLDEGKLTWRFDTSSKVLSVAYHPNGRRLVTVGQDRIVRLWDLVTGQEILELEDTTGNVRAVGFSHDGRFLAAAGLHVCRIWDAVNEWKNKPAEGN